VTVTIHVPHDDILAAESARVDRGLGELLAQSGLQGGRGRQFLA
jgi:hypothetical protein